MASRIRHQDQLIEKLCRRFEARGSLSGFLDCELSGPDSRTVKLHLSECKTCRETIGDMTHLRHASLKMNFRIPNEYEWARHWTNIFDKI